MLARLRFYAARAARIRREKGLSGLAGSLAEFLVRRRFFLGLAAESLEYHFAARSRSLTATALSVPIDRFPANARRVLFYASFDPASRVGPHVVAQLRAFRELGYAIVFVSVSPKLDAAALDGLCDVAIHRRNVGYDFGSWKVAYGHVRDLLGDAESVILMNDSCEGPEFSLEPLVSRMVADGDAVWGATLSYEMGKYIQSYFIHFGAARVRDGTLAAYMDRVRLLRTKWGIVRFLEIGGSRWLARRGVALHAWVDPAVEPVAGLLARAGETDPIVDPVGSEIVRLGLTPFYKRSNLRRLRVRKIGIALAAYKPDPAVFAEQLASIAAQDFADWKCFITVDSPLAPLRSEASLHAYFEDPRFVWSENSTRLGHRLNFERAIALAASGTDAVACADQDDVWYPNKLSRCARELERAGPLSLVHSDLHVLRDGVVDRASSVWKIENRKVQYVQPWQLCLRNVVTGCTMLFDAELARRYPRVPECFGFHDHWFAAVASGLGGVHPIHEQLIAYRQHGGNVVGVTEYQLVPRIRTRDELRKRLRLWHDDAVTIRERALELTRAGISVPAPASPLHGFLRGTTYLGRDPVIAKSLIRTAIGVLQNSRR